MTSRRLSEAPTGQTPDGGLRSRLRNGIGALSQWSVRHPVLFVFLVALGVRCALAISIAAVAAGAVFRDDATYSMLAEQRASGETQAWNRRTYALYDRTSTLLIPLTALYRLLGPQELAGQLLVALFGAIAAAAVTKLSLLILPRSWALLPGLVVALLPSQVLFSSLILKDAAVWAVLAVMAVLVAELPRARGSRQLLAWGGVLVLVYLLAHLRMHTVVVAMWALAIAAWLGPRSGRWRRGATATAALLLVPYLLGIGVAGLGLVTSTTGSLDERRANNAAGAATAFVAPSTVDDPPGASVEGEGAPAPGTPARTDREPAGTAGRDLAALPRGVSVMLLEPFPGATYGNPRLQLALAENLVWWPVVALALVGCAGAWGRRTATAFPLLVAGATVMLYALSEGNFGTAYRHRGEFVWAIAFLAGLGAYRLFSPQSRVTTKGES